MPTYFNSYKNGSDVYCDASVDLTCEFVDSLNRTNCGEFMMVDCTGDGPCDKLTVNNGLLLCDCGDSVNCQKCSTDFPYFNPVQTDDTLFFQFQQLDVASGQNPAGPFGNWGPDLFATAFAKDCCTGEYLGGNETPTELSSIADHPFVGVFPVRNYKGEITWKNIQSISFSVADINAAMLAYFGPTWNGCFTLEFCFEGPTEPYCVCSEPFQVDSCPETSATVLLEGVFPDRDCFGYYYGDEAVGNGTFDWENRYRVAGSIEPTTISIEKDMAGPQRKSTGVDMNQNWLFRTKGVPFRVAELIGNILSARDVYANTIEYKFDGEITKNNDTGLQWYMEATLQKLKCQKSYSCE